MVDEGQHMCSHVAVYVLFPGGTNGQNAFWHGVLECTWESGCLRP